MIKKLDLAAFVLLFSLFFQCAHAATLSPVEKQTVTYITHAKEEQLKLLEQLVNINSGTENLSGVRQVGELLRPQFEQLGFRTYWSDMPADMNKAPALIAEHQGNVGKKLLLTGHLDTVFPKNSPFQTFTRHKKTATGPGIIDDKGGIVVILYALKALHAAHALDHATIRVVLMGDEEAGGKPFSISRKPLFEIAQHTDVALDFEWAINLNTAAAARRGIASWTLRTEGKDEHSSEIFEPAVGYGAIFELTRVLSTALNALSKEDGLTFSPGIVLGGNSTVYDKMAASGTASGKVNVVAKTAMARGDLRFLTKAQEMKAQNRMRQIVKQPLPGTTSSIEFNDGIPAMPQTDNNLALLNLYSQVSTDLGQGPIKPTNASLRGAADISHIADIVPAKLAGIGALGEGAHSVHESLNIDALPIQTERAALLIYRLTQPS